MQSSAFPELMLALDFSDTVVAESWIDRLKGEPVIFKVGLELFLSAGPKWVAEQTRHGHRIFLDLKLHDIPNTVAQSVGVACDLGVEFLTIHLSGGEEMLRMSSEKVREKKSRLRLLGVSVLTSYSEEQWGQTLGAFGASPVSVEKSVNGLASLAKNTGVPGLVCSALDLVSVQKIYPDAFTVTPGVRLEVSGASHQDQKRVVTPAQARELGSRAIVMGRPIFQSADPLGTLQKVLKDLKS